MADDRISQLPIPIRHHILCFLSQKEAVRTCLLSKQWRHLGSTRPNLEFSEEWFDETQEEVVSVNSSIGSTSPSLNSSEELINSTQEKFVPVDVVDRTLQHRRSTLPNLDSSEKLFNATQQNFVSVDCSIGSTRRSLESSENLCNSTTQQNFVSVVNRTLQGYLDQNLSIHKLHFNISRPDSRPVVSLLDKWIPIIALDIKAFKLNFLSYTPQYYDLPSTVFESLEELHLRKCRLSPAESVRFKNLRTLTLEQVQVDGDTLDTNMLGCPLLRRLVLYCCWELRNVRVSEAASPGLNHFQLCDHERIEGGSIEIDVPNLKRVFIAGPWIWSHRQSTFLFSRLTSLSLFNVILSSESFDLFSSGCPTLASLTLYNCFGFEEFHLASDSVKLLTIFTRIIPLKGVTIWAPNILDFTFTARIHQVPDTFSFTTTTSKEWDSGIFLSSYEEDPDLDVNLWFLEVRRLLKALSGSRISLYLQMDGGPQDVPCNAVLGDEPPMVVQYLKFTTCKCLTASWYLEFTNGLFCVCRPSCVWGGRLVSGSDRNYRLSEFQLNMLLAYKNIRTEPYFWRHDLEQVHVDGQLVQWTGESELRNRTYDGKIWLYLNWRGQTTHKY
ncbi:F-box/FBD/LRR-repeat protein [Striga hermonthica]|uniref:F-box/FBD/LRR-repeat protein n=1 Tax=Striga hermonthica TaxID=68872 RepID=A0A9N7NRG4_STRHE|nr:F-box/FBD/LRR-repeat protein [Striga hermonthica]